MIYIYIYILVNRTLLKCTHWFELVSQVSDVAHGPPVRVILHEWYMVCITKFSFELFDMLCTLFILVHLSLRLKWCCLIKICTLSVVVVGVVVNFSNCHLRLQNNGMHWLISTKLGTDYPWVKGIQFLAHLSWKLKWTFLITCRPSSVCLSVRLSVCLSVRL